MGAADLIRTQERFSYILLCYAIDSQRSFTDLEDWVSTINANPKGSITPIALVGTKNDLSRVVNDSSAYNFMEQINREAINPNSSKNPEV